MIKILLLLTLFIFGDLKEELSKIILNDYIEFVSRTKEGKRLLDMVNKDELKIYFEYADDKWLAWYEPYGKIFFNLKYLMIFFNVEDYDIHKIQKVLRFAKDVRKEFVKYSDFLFIHEIVHHLQYKKYKNLVNYRDVFVEFEWEAFIYTDLYFFEKMKKNKKMFLDIISFKYYDLYTDYAMGGFISSLNDYDKYLDEIKERYLNEISGYVSLRDFEKEKRMKLEERRILSYASGQRRSYELSKNDYEKIRKTMESYFSKLKTELKRKWDNYIVDALIFVNKTSIEAKNYELLWRSCYFLKSLHNRECYMTDSIVDDFIKHILQPSEKEGLIDLVNEIYWYKKFFPQDKKLENFIGGILKEAILYCDKFKNNECLKKIDFISTTDLIK